MRSPNPGWRSTILEGTYIKLHLAYCISLFHPVILPRGRHSRPRFRLLRILTSYEKLLNRLLTFHTPGNNYPPRVHVLVGRPIVFVHQMLNRYRYLGQSAEVPKMGNNQKGSAYLHSRSLVIPVIHTLGGPQAVPPYSPSRDAQELKRGGSDAKRSLL